MFFLVNYVTIYKPLDKVKEFFTAYKIFCCLHHLLEFIKNFIIGKADYKVKLTEGLSTYFFLVKTCLLYIYIYLFCCTGPQLRQARSLVVACDSQLQHACGISFPDQQSNPGPLQQECGVLTTVPPGKSLYDILLFAKEHIEYTELTIYMGYQNLQRVSYALEFAKDFAVSKGYYTFQVLCIVEST